ncbi:hypothetical protein KAI04_00095 [Candidatus Pacearchaeota archaeon]|nr:hypothetical protein [Candidatus Pacearchaeota archaeon]
MDKKITGQNLIVANKNKEIVEHLFTNYHSRSEIYAKIDPKGYDQYKKSLIIRDIQGGIKPKPRKAKHYSKTPINNKIVEAFKIFYAEGFLIQQKPIQYRKQPSKTGKLYSYPIKRYKLNPNFFFDYVKKELKGNYFTKKEILEIRFYLDNPNIRKMIVKNYNKQNNLIEKIKYFLLDFYVISETDFYFRFFSETITNYKELLKLNEKGKNSNILWRLSDYEIGGEKEQTKIKKDIGKKIKLLFGFDGKLTKEFSSLF